MKTIIFFTLFFFITIDISIAQTPITGIVISEFSYNPPEAGVDSLEYIELYNTNPTAVDMTGAYFIGVNYTFPSGYMIPATDYAVIAVNPTALNSQFGYITDQNWSGGLGNNGENIILYDALNNVVDVVGYDDGGDWPGGGTTQGAPDGGGASLVLCDMTADNSLGSNWIASTTATGIEINGYSMLGSPGSSGSSCALPIELISFDGKIDNNISFLEWKTGSEINNDYFILEYSTNGKDYKKIGRIDGSGNSIIEKTYSFHHTIHSIGFNYYRLIQVDFDGTQYQKGLISLKSKGQKRLTIFPNPVKSILNYSFTTLSNEIVIASIYDTLGKKVFETEVAVQRGYNQLDLQLPKLIQGVYFLQLEQGSQIPMKNTFIFR